MALADSLPKGPTLGDTIMAGTEARRTQEAQISQTAEAAEQQRLNTSMTALTSMFIKDIFAKEGEERQWGRTKKELGIKDRYKQEAETRLEGQNKREAYRKMYLAYHDSLGALAAPSTVGDEGLIAMWMKGESRSWQSGGGGGRGDGSTSVAPAGALDDNTMKLIANYGEGQSRDTYAFSDTTRKNLQWEIAQNKYWNEQLKGYLDLPIMNGQSAKTAQRQGSFNGIPKRDRLQIINVLKRMQQAQERARLAAIRHRVLTMQGIQEFLGEDMLPIDQQFEALAGLHEENRQIRQAAALRGKQGSEEEGEATDPTTTSRRKRKRKPAHRGADGPAPVSEESQKPKRDPAETWKRDQQLLLTRGLGSFWTTSVHEERRPKPRAYQQVATGQQQPVEFDQTEQADEWAEELERSGVPSTQEVARAAVKQINTNKSFNNAVGYTRVGHIRGIDTVRSSQEQALKRQNTSIDAQVQRYITSNKAKFTLTNQLLTSQKQDILDNMIRMQGKYSADFARLAEMSDKDLVGELGANTAFAATSLGMLGDPSISAETLLAEGDEMLRSRARILQAAMPGAPPRKILTALLLREMMDSTLSSKLSEATRKRAVLPTRIGSEGEKDLPYANDPNVALNPSNRTHIAGRLEHWALQTLADSPEGQQALYAVATGRQPGPGGNVLYSQHGDAAKMAGRNLKAGIQIMISNPGIQERYKELLGQADQDGRITPTQWQSFRSDCLTILREAAAEGIAPLDALSRSGGIR
jgi:hypothetical protein